MEMVATDANTSSEDDLPQPPKYPKPTQKYKVNSFVEKIFQHSLQLPPSLEKNMWREMYLVQ